MKILPIVLAILVVVTAWPAWIASNRPEAPPELTDRYFGVELEVEDEAEVRSLADELGKVRIVTWEDQRPREIVVEQHGGTWRIRTRHDYPADAERRLGETAGRVIGLRKLREVTSDPAYHRELGVVDPLDETVGGDEGRGQRATLWSDQGEVLVDLIVGDLVEGQPDQRYAREADSPTVYTAEIEGALSSRFIDWVQPNPFDLEAGHVTSIAIEDYSIDEAQQSRELRSQTAFTRADAESDWVSEQVPVGAQVAQDAVDAIASKAASLRLADIARRLGLGARELAARGIFPTQDGIYGNEGVVHLGTRLGYTWHIFFGGVAGSATEVEDGEAADSDRIVATWVSYAPADDVTLPQVPQEPTPPEEDADEAAREAHQRAAAEREALIAEREQHLAQRRATVDRLNAKYQDHFYVIRDADFRTLRPPVDDLFDPAAEEAEAPDPATPAGE